MFHFKNQYLYKHLHMKNVLIYIIFIFLLFYYSIIFAQSTHPEVEFCTYNLDLLYNETFNIRDYLHVKDQGLGQQVDYNEITFTYTDVGANDPTVPVDWNLTAFNNGDNITVTAADNASGTGNHGQGRYRIYVYRNGETEYDDHMTIRVENSSSSLHESKCEDLTADLSLTKTMDNPSPSVGATVTFTLQITHQGGEDATNVQVRDVLPSGYTYIASSMTGGDVQDESNAPTLVWTINSLLNGNNINLTFQATVNNTGELKNVAEIIASDHTDPDSTPDSDDGDQSEDDEDSATAFPPSIVADLELTKTVNNASPLMGETVTFTIAITNNGPSATTNVIVEDVLPSGFSYVESSMTGGDAQDESSAPVLNWTINNLANGVTVNLSFDAIVNTTGNYTNTAQVTASDQPDLDSTPNNDDGNQSEDDEDFATLTPRIPPVIGVAKIADTPTDNGDGTFSVTYTVLVKNMGTVTMYDLQLSDDLTTEFGTYEANSANVDAVGEYALISSPSISTSTGGSTIATLNATYNGDTDQNIIEPTASENMPVDASFTLTFAIRFYPSNGKNTYSNQAVGSADESEDTVADGDATDLSDDAYCVDSSINGGNPTPTPDVNCDGDPTGTGENDTTTFTITISNCSASAGTLSY